MKRLLILASLLALFPASVSASCGFGCLHRQIEAIRRQTLPQRVSGLEARLAQDEAQIKAQDAQITRLEAKASQVEGPLSKLQVALNCFGEVPITRYGNKLGPSGYLFHLEGPSPQTIATTALDVSYPKDAVGTWIFVNACNKERLTPQSSLADDTTRFVQPGN